MHVVAIFKIAQAVMRLMEGIQTTINHTHIRLEYLAKGDAWMKGDEGVRGRCCCQHDDPLAARVTQQGVAQFRLYKTMPSGEEGRRQGRRIMTTSICEASSATKCFER